MSPVLSKRLLTVLILLCVGYLSVSPARAQAPEVLPTVKKQSKLRLLLGFEGRGWEPIADQYSEPGHFLNPVWFQGPQIGIGIQGKRNSELLLELGWLRIRNYLAQYTDSLGPASWDASEREVWFRISRRWTVFQIADRFRASLAVGGNLGFSRLVFLTRESNRFNRDWDEVFIEAFAEPRFQFKVWERIHLNLNLPLYLSLIHI